MTVVLLSQMQPTGNVPPPPPGDVAVFLMPITGVTTLVYPWGNLTANATISGVTLETVRTTGGVI